MRFRSLEFRKLTFSYLEQPLQPEDYVFHELSYSLPMEKVVCFQGPTGAGKNTLMKILGGLEDPKGGEFLVNGENLFAKAERERFAYRRCLGYGFAQGGLLQNRTLRENLELALQSLTNLSKGEIDRRLDEDLSYFGLEDSQDLRPSLVSGGKRMTTCLARALIHEPEMLILNHPTNGLSQATQDALVKRIRSQLQSGSLRHVFMVSENEKFWSEFDCFLISVNRSSFEAVA